MVWGSNPCGGEIFRICPDRHCTGSFPWVRCGWGVTLTPHPLLVPRSNIEWSYTCVLPKGHHGLWKGETYLKCLAVTVHVWFIWIHTQVTLGKFTCHFLKQLTALLTKLYFSASIPWRQTCRLYFYILCPQKLVFCSLQFLYCYWF